MAREMEIQESAGRDGWCTSSIDDFVSQLRKETCLLRQSEILQSVKVFLEKGPKEFLSSVQEDKAQVFLSSIAHVGIVKDFAEHEIRDFEASDFTYLPETAELCFSCLKIICQRCIAKEFPLPSCSTLVPVLLLCGTHHQEFLWSSKASVTGSKELSQTLCLLLDKKNVREILIHQTRKDSNIAKDVLTHLKSSLNKEKWRRNPCTRQIFKWLLFHLKHFELPDLLPHVLPPSLLFVDDHVSENKLLGIHCMHHIIKNVPPTVLSWQGRADVVYDALHHLLYTHEPDIINALHPCLLDLLDGMEPDPNSSERPLKPCRYDELFSSLLSSMSVEQKISLRNAYSAQLPLYVDKMGITILSHDKKLFDVIEEYLSTYDGPSEFSRLNILMTVQLIIKVAWPRIPSHCGLLLKCLLRLLYDFKINPPNVSDKVREEVLQKIKESLILLKKACPDTFQDLTCDVAKLKGVAEPVVEIVRDVRDGEVNVT